MDRAYGWGVLPSIDGYFKFYFYKWNWHIFDTKPSEMVVIKRENKFNYFIPYLIKTISTKYGSSIFKRNMWKPILPLLLKWTE